MQNIYSVNRLSSFCPCNVAASGPLYVQGRATHSLRTARPFSTFGRAPAPGLRYATAGGSALGPSPMQAPRLRAWAAPPLGAYQRRCLRASRSRPLLVGPWRRGARERDREREREPQMRTRSRPAPHMPTPSLGAAKAAAQGALACGGRKQTSAFRDPEQDLTV